MIVPSTNQNLPFFNNRNIRIAISGFLSLEDLARLIQTCVFFGGKKEGCFREDVHWRVWGRRFLCRTNGKKPFNSLYEAVCHDRTAYFRQLKEKILKIFRENCYIIFTGSYPLQRIRYKDIENVRYSELIEAVEEARNCYAPQIVRFISDDLLHCVEIILRSSEKIPSTIRKEAIYKCEQEELYCFIPLLKPDLLDVDDRTSIIAKFILDHVDLPLLRLLKNSGPVKQGGEGRMLICAAARNPEFVPDLLKEKAISDEIRGEAALNALRGGHTETALEILRSGNITYKYQEEILEIACKHGYESFLREYIKINRRIFIRDLGAFIIIALKNRYLDIALFLLKHGPVSSKCQEEVLEIACDLGYETFLRECIELGWKISDHNRGIFVIKALKSGYLNIVRLLLRHGDISPGFRADAIHIAISNYYSELLEELEPSKVNEMQRGKLLSFALQRRFGFLIIFGSGPFQHDDFGDLFFAASRCKALEICNSLFNDERLTNRDLEKAIFLAISFHENAFLKKHLILMDFSPEKRGKMILQACAIDNYEALSLVWGKLSLEIEDYKQVVFYILNHKDPKKLIDHLELNHLKKLDLLWAITLALRKKFSFAHQIADPESLIDTFLSQEGLALMNSHNDFLNVQKFLFSLINSVTLIEKLVIFVALNQGNPCIPPITDFPLTAISHKARNEALRRFIDNEYIRSRLNELEVFHQLKALLLSGAMEFEAMKYVALIIANEFAHQRIKPEVYELYSMYLPLSQKA